jgi:hypothetical protein
VKAVRRDKELPELHMGAERMVLSGTGLLPRTQEQIDQELVETFVGEAA